MRLALAVGLDAANVVGRGALQNLQKPLQGGLQGRRCGQADPGRLRPSAGPWEWLPHTAQAVLTAETGILLGPGMIMGGAHGVQVPSRPDLPLLLTPRLQGPS